MSSTALRRIDSADVSPATDATAGDAASPSAMLPTTFQQAEAFAQAVARSTFVPDAFRGKPGDVLACIITGHELGLGPMQALRSIHVVKGKPILSADLMVALVKRSSACRYFRVVESTPERAVYETQREGDPEPTRLAWTMQDAKRAKLTGNGNWQKHPAAMLRARCSSALARAVYPDMVAGVYEEDEGTEIGDVASPAGRQPSRAPERGPTEFPGASLYGGSEPDAGGEPVVEDAEVVEEVERGSGIREPAAPIVPQTADPTDRESRLEAFNRWINPAVRRFRASEVTPQQLGDELRQVTAGWPEDAAAGALTQLDRILDEVRERSASERAQEATEGKP